MMPLEEKFLKAYDEFSDAIFRHCYFRVSDREVAKDLAQESFTKTWQYMADGSQVDNIKAFLYKTANNLIIDLYRKKKTVSLEKMQEEGFEPSSDDRNSLENSIEHKRIIKVIGQLEPAYRDVILMRYVDDLSPKEIAKIVGESENIISVRIHRGVKKLKELLNK